MHRRLSEVALRGVHKLSSKSKESLFGHEEITGHEIITNHDVAKHLIGED